MSQKFTMIIDKNVYSMGAKTAQSTLNTVKDSVKNSYCIYALEKGNVITMTKLTYLTRDILKKRIAAYIQEGFKVHYTMPALVLAK